MLHISHQKHEMIDISRRVLKKSDTISILICVYAFEEFAGTPCRLRLFEEQRREATFSHPFLTVLSFQRRQHIFPPSWRLNPSDARAFLLFRRIFWGVSDVRRTEQRYVT